MRIIDQKGGGRNGKGDARQPSSFAMGFVSSEAFKALFKEGMTLVEDAAGYLDGAGRADARALARMPALAYASESMRLTTRLMQIASWLLLQRAVVEGELSPEQAKKEKHKVRIVIENQPAAAGNVDQLPEQMRELIGRSLRMQARVVHLDQLLNNGQAPIQPDTESPVAAQIDMLRSAFARKVG